MRRYAERTAVTPDTTLRQIRNLVTGAGAKGFATVEEWAKEQPRFRTMLQTPGIQTDLPALPELAPEE